MALMAARNKIVPAFGPSMPRYSELARGVRRLVAPNPSMMTGPGTNTYLFGESSIAVLDPGPHIDAHIDSIQETAGAPIRWIFVTHTHPDHSPLLLDVWHRVKMNRESTRLNMSRMIYLD